MKKLILMMGICCFSVGVLADTKTEILQDKVERMEAELSLLQRKLYQTPDASLSKTTSVPSNIDDFYTQLDTQNQLIQELTQKVEQLEFKISTLTNKLDQVNQDVDFRLNELSSQKPQAQSAESKPQNASDKAA